MKYLTRFNEGNEIIIESEMDKDYLDNCFVDFIDNGSITKLEEKWQISKSGSIKTVYAYSLEISAKYLLPKNLEEILENAVKLKDDVEELEVCMKKVKMQYPNAIYSSTMKNTSIRFSLSKRDFHQPI
jgi:hypothetical protein|tara:strand:- start:188 stop:571 length:384 start_codon:yes stop_codon:yes gene_type:complete